MGFNIFPAPSAGGKELYVETFTSSGTFTLPAGYDGSNPLKATVLIVGGGGGGGGGGRVNYSNGTGNGGAGGGSGIAYYLEDIFITAATSTVTIGAGGAGGIGSTFSGSQQFLTGTAGAAGGNTTFGEYTASGGRGGGGGGASSQGNSSGVAGTVSSTITDAVFGQLSIGRAPTRPDTSTTFGIARGGPGGSGGGNTATAGGRFGGIGIGSDQFGDFERSTLSTSRSYIWTTPLIDLPGASQGIPYTDRAHSASTNSMYISFYPTLKDANKNWYIPGGGSGGQNNGNTTAATGGAAGTISSTQTAASTSQDGVSAASNSGAGGGGAAGRRDNTPGNGGAGGSGYVRIWYWA